MFCPLIIFLSTSLKVQTIPVCHLKYLSCVILSSSTSSFACFLFLSFSKPDNINTFRMKAPVIGWLDLTWVWMAEPSACALFHEPLWKVGAADWQPAYWLPFCSNPEGSLTLFKPLRSTMRLWVISPNSQQAVERLHENIRTLVLLLLYHQSWMSPILNSKCWNTEFKKEKLKKNPRTEFSMVSRVEG